MDIAEVSDLYGVPVYKAYRLASDGIIPAQRRPSGRLVFMRTEVEESIKQLPQLIGGNRVTPLTVDQALALIAADPSLLTAHKAQKTMSKAEMLVAEKEATLARARHAETLAAKQRQNAEANQNIANELKATVKRLEDELAYAHMKADVEKRKNG